MWRERRVETAAGAGFGRGSDSAWTGPGAAPGHAAAVAIDQATACLRAGLATVAGAGLLAAGFVLACRLLSASWEAPSALVVLATGLAAIALVKVADLASDVAGPRLVPLAARCGLVAAVAAMTLTPRTGTAGDWVARAVIVAAAAAALPAPRRRARARRRRREPAPPPVRPARRHTVTRRRLPGSLRQRFARFEQPDGTDAVSGTLVVVIPAGAKVGYGHVGFCPSFAALPSVEVTTRYDGVDATVAAAEILPWGLRVECRLADTAEESLEIPVSILARVPPAPITLP